MGKKENSRHRDLHVQRPSGKRQHVAFKELQEDLSEGMTKYGETKGARGQLDLTELLRSCSKLWALSQ